MEVRTILLPARSGTPCHFSKITFTYAISAVYNLESLPTHGFYQAPLNSSDACQCSSVMYMMLVACALCQEPSENAQIPTYAPSLSLPSLHFTSSLGGSRGHRNALISPQQGRHAAFYWTRHLTKHGLHSQISGRHPFRHCCTCLGIPQSRNVPRTGIRELVNH